MGEINEEEKGQNHNRQRTINRSDPNGINLAHKPRDMVELIKLAKMVGQWIGKSRVCR